MRHVLLTLSLLTLSLPLLAQPKRGGRNMMDFPASAEAMIKQAVERLAAERRMLDRDIEVLRRLRAADAALADTMQPSNALQKAYEEASEAKRLGPDFVVMQGVIKVVEALDEARHSPGMADINHLRAGLREEALGPASRVAVQNAQRLQEETIAWLNVQQQITTHLRTLSDLAGESLRAAEQP